MDGVCAESALPEKARLRVRSMSGLTMTPLGSMPLPPPTPATRTRVPLSLIRCAEVCSEPELLPGNIMCYRTMTDRAAKLLWSSRPSTFLLVKKWKDSGVTAYVLPLVKWLLAKKGVRVYVSSDDNIPEGAHLYTPANEQEIDVVITVGGDGTVLHMSSLFQSACPPVLSIAFGSLGFLTSIEPGEARPALEALLNGDSEPVEFTPRARLRASIYRSGSLEPESSQLGLNELILERGPSPYMTALDTYLDDVYLTVCPRWLVGWLCVSQSPLTIVILGCSCRLCKQMVFWWLRPQAPPPTPCLLAAASCSRQYPR